MFWWRAARRRTARADWSIALRCAALPLFIYYWKYGGVVRYAVDDLCSPRRVNNSQNAARETGPHITCEAKPPAPGTLLRRASVNALHLRGIIFKGGWRHAHTTCACYLSLSLTNGEDVRLLLRLGGAYMFGSQTWFMIKTKSVKLEKRLLNKNRNSVYVC